MYLQTMTQLISETKNPQHERHIYEFVKMVDEMIEEKVPQIVERVMQENYMDILVKLQMILDGREVNFEQVSDYIINEIRNIIKSKLK